MTMAPHTLSPQQDDVCFTHTSLALVYSWPRISHAPRLSSLTCSFPLTYHPRPFPLKPHKCLAACNKSPSGTLVEGSLCLRMKLLIIELHTLSCPVLCFVSWAVNTACKLLFCGCNKVASAYTSREYFAATARNPQ